MRRQAIAAKVGAIAQLGERVLCKHEVVGSIPSGSTIFVDAGDSASRSRPPARHIRDRRDKVSTASLASVVDLPDIVKRD